MDIYENIIVGNFLFGLGVQMGMNRTTTGFSPIAVNLVQQTPLDEKLGDVVIANSRVIRLLEFKREANHSDKERGKLKAVQEAIALNSQDGLEGISRNIHLYVNSDFRQRIRDRMEIGVCPYLDFLNPRSELSLIELIETTAKEAVGDPLDEETLALSRCYLRMVSGLSAKGGSSGCLVLFIGESGNVSYASLDDVSQVYCFPRQIFQMELLKAREIEGLSPTQDLKPAVQHDAAIRHGFGLGR